MDKVNVSQIDLNKAFQKVLGGNNIQKAILTEIKESLSKDYIIEYLEERHPGIRLALSLDIAVINTTRLLKFTKKLNNNVYDAYLNYNWRGNFISLNWDFTNKRGFGKLLCIIREDNISLDRNSVLEHSFVEDYKNFVLDIANKVQPFLKPNSVRFILDL